MLRPVAALMLALQLSPFAGAALCVHQSVAADEDCEMVMSQPASTPESTSPPPDPHQPTECAFAQLCAIPVGMALSIQSSIVTYTIEASTTVPSYTDKLFAADPAAPLVPPPNS